LVSVKKQVASEISSLKEETMPIRTGGKKEMTYQDKRGSRGGGGEKAKKRIGL